MSTWKRVHKQSGATVTEKHVGNFRGTISDMGPRHYVYNVTELPMGDSSFHKRGTVTSMAGAKRAADRLLSRLTGGTVGRRRR